MIIFIIVTAIVLIGIYLEFAGPKFINRYLYCQSEVDKYLIEPDEGIVYKQSVSNFSYLPALYVNAKSIFHNEAVFLESDEWKKSHLYYSSFEPSCKYRLYLLGGRRWSSKIRFTFDKRGCYQFGSYYIETGDIFGLRSYVEKHDSNHEIVVMPRLADKEYDWKAYRGFIGDISVQRFIMEDPILTVGFREYTGHEPMKSISFTQTARRGTTYVKCYDHTTELNVTILLNMFDNRRSALEKCLEIARTVSEDLEDRHISYGFMSNGDVGEYITAGLGKYHYTNLMKKMGLSSLAGFYSLERLLKKCEDMAMGESYGYILITPPLNADDMTVVREFEKKLSSKLCILVGGDE